MKSRVQSTIAGIAEGVLPLVERDEGQKISFSGAVFDLQSLDLRVDGQEVSVEPIPKKILRHLIEHQDKTVHKDELLATVWGAKIISNASLPIAIQKLREALGKVAGARIVTVPRLGYRFVSVPRDSAQATDFRISSTTPVQDLLKEIVRSSSSSLGQILETGMHASSAQFAAIIFDIGIPAIQVGRIMDESQIQAEIRRVAASKSQDSGIWTERITWQQSQGLAESCRCLFIPVMLLGGQRLGFVSIGLSDLRDDDGELRSMAKGFVIAIELELSLQMTSLRGINPHSTVSYGATLKVLEMVIRHAMGSFVYVLTSGWLDSQGSSMPATRSVPVFTGALGEGGTISLYATGAQKDASEDDVVFHDGGDARVIRFKPDTSPQYAVTQIANHLFGLVGF